MERVFGQDKTLPFDTEASNNTDSYHDIVETTNHNLQSEITFRKIVDHFWRDGMFMTKAQYEDTIQGSLVISTPFAKIRRDEPFHTQSISADTLQKLEEVIDHRMIGFAI